jgi:ADP-heptose:LPS heptosyltransferase
MSGPAIRALKESFGAKITVLTSSMAAGIAKQMAEIDEVIVFDMPWVKTDAVTNSQVFNATVENIKKRKFDAAIVFTVYSQNPLPAVMLAYLAGIPNRLAYCRENPYQLLTNWVPDPEPYEVIKHQVERDLDLVASVGAVTQNRQLHLSPNNEIWTVVEQKLGRTGIDTGKKWMLLHAGVSEEKRQYPIDKWIETGKSIVNDLGYQLVLTGSASEESLTQKLQDGIGTGSFSTGGLFSLEEFILLISRSPLILSVNTGTIHIAASVGTPVVVLYALTNPQHTPWGVPNFVFPFTISPSLQSKNEVIKFVNDRLYDEPVEMPTVMEITKAIKKLMSPAYQKHITGKNSIVI